MNLIKYSLYIILLTPILACENKENKSLQQKLKEEENKFSNFNKSFVLLDDIEKNFKNDLLSSKFKNNIYTLDKLVYDEDSNVAYVSGFIEYAETGRKSIEVGNYVYNFKEGVICNSYVDKNKTERRIEDGDTEKTYVNGNGRAFGVRLYSEYDKNDLNKRSIIQIDTTCQNIDLFVEEKYKNKESKKGINISGNGVKLEGIPLYSSTIDAVNDSKLPSGSLFKTNNNDGSSQLHIKE